MGDPSVWIFSRGGRSIGVVGTHVDDFIITGDENNSEWARIVESIKAAFRWTPWERDNFKQTGL